MPITLGTAMSCGSDVLVLRLVGVDVVVLRLVICAWAEQPAAATKLTHATAISFCID